MFSSLRVPWPRRFLNARCSFSVRFSNMSASVYREQEFTVLSS
jgi:hypothetical protein